MIPENHESRATAEAQTIEEIIACEECGYRWPTRSDMERVTCPSCQHKTPRDVVTEQKSVLTKSTTEGAESIEEMALLHEKRADTLRLLSDDGWSLREKVSDGWAHLTREPVGGGEDGN